MACRFAHNRRMDANEIRIVLVIVGALLLGAIYWIGRPKRVGPGRREPKFPWQSDDSAEGAADAQGAREPYVGALADTFAASDVDADASLSGAADDAESVTPQPGGRVQREFDLIISLHVMARDEGLISGSELIVATEKVSLIYGAQGLFHRLVDGRPEAGPIFSMINRLQPGRFELSKITELATPGVSFFMTLPCGLAGLDAWDRMLPAAQRLAGLLNADIYDDEMNLLGRQRIAGIRDELRAYDRKVEVRAR
jgi:cell division protein ZipA